MKKESPVLRRSTPRVPGDFSGVGFIGMGAGMIFRPFSAPAKPATPEPTIDSLANQMDDRKGVWWAVQTPRK